MTDEKERVAKFVAPLMPFDCSSGWGQFAAIGYELDGKLIAGTIYHNWSPEARVIELSSAAADPRWLTRKSILEMMHFPFSQLNCQMIVIRVSERNTHMRSIARRFGFTEYVIPRLDGPDTAGCVYTLTVEQWRAKGFEKIGQAGSTSNP